MTKILFFSCAFLFSMNLNSSESSLTQEKAALLNSISAEEIAARNQLSSPIESLSSEESDDDGFVNVAADREALQGIAALQEECKKSDAQIAELQLLSESMQVRHGQLSDDSLNHAGLDGRKKALQEQIGLMNKWIKIKSNYSNDLKRCFRSCISNLKRINCSRCCRSKQQFSEDDE
jgi:hypothetical protein